ncbi:hypothetical protein BAY59_10665 [Prauserella coralliicola]|nr:hypothetical protein BAY59_10665 [Prauserella coralliicola]
MALADITCYTDASYSDQYVVTVDSTLDFSQIWARGAHGCEATLGGTPMTEVERRAWEISGYTSDDISTLYALCAAVDQLDPYASADFSPTAAQVKEIEAMLTLCPGHPFADAYRAAVERGRGNAELESSGRLFAGGTYRVGEEVEAGTYAVEADIENCYWERTDADGNIIDNNFVNGAKRVEVTIQATDYSFHSQGCGTWRPAG